METWAERSEVWRRPMDMRRLLLALMLLLLALPLAAQKKGKRGIDRTNSATLVHPAIVYVQADEGSQKSAEVLPGHEVVVLERSGTWIKVFANTDEPDRLDEDKTPEFNDDDAQAAPVAGWIKDKGLVTPQTPAGDAILYGAAANLEDLASHPHAPKDAATEAHLLYRRCAEYFPNSGLAGDAAFRSADIRWQMEKIDNSTLPSAKEQEAYLRPQLFDGDLKRVMKQYPNSDAAFRAAYDLIDNKLCGDWQGLPKCPEMEAGLYLKYADQYRQSSRAPEALYNAVYRSGVLVTMYQVEDNRKRADAAADRVQRITADMVSRFPMSEYTRRAQSIAYRVGQGLSIYGNDRE